MAEPILLFDGVCGFCSGVVRFVLAHERDARLRFAPLQSEAGRRLLRERGVPAAIDSLVLVTADRAFVRSDAALAVAARLRWPYWWAGILWLVPRPLRDLAYDAFARRRYSVFGRTEACMVAPASAKDRFL